MTVLEVAVRTEGDALRTGVDVCTEEEGVMGREREREMQHAHANTNAKMVLILQL